MAGKREPNLIDRVCVGDIPTRTADLYPENIAIIDGDASITYRELDRQASRLGHALLGLGLGYQEPVGVMARNCIELAVTYFACARAGLVCTPINLGLKPHEIAYCLNDAKVRVLIVEGVFAEAAAALPAQLPALERVYWIGPGGNPGVERSAGTFEELLASGHDAPLEVYVGERDAVQLLYTSGTTANPKGVLTSHVAATFAAMSNCLALSLPPEYSVLVNLPLFHCTAVNTLMIPALLRGGRCVLTKGFDVREAARLIEQYRIGIFVFLPMMYAELLADEEARSRDFSAVRAALYAMAPMPESRLKEIHEVFPNADVILGSGQTEFTPATCMIRPEHQWTKAGSWGTATAMTRIAIMDDDGNLLPPGQTGEIVYRGPQMMNAYLNQPEATENAFRHGWFHSGDVAWMDEDGAVWFTDRKKDVIKTGGENVASLDVERCLMEHPDVAEAAVVGLPHPRWGEAITGIVVLKTGARFDEAALLAHCRERLAGFKVPKAIIAWDEFPRTGTGKIQKHVTRSRLQELYEKASAG